MQSARSSNLGAHRLPAGTTRNAPSSSTVKRASDQRSDTSLPNMASRFCFGELYAPKHFTHFAQTPADYDLGFCTQEVDRLFMLILAACNCFLEYRSAVPQIAGLLLIFAMAYAIYLFATPLI